jgi:excinuclease ABC subunit C
MYLSGRVKSLRTALEREMKLAAKEERFEEAAMMRGQLFALDHVQDVSLIREDRDRDETSPRIEAYDTAHLSGTNAIGVMVVVDGGIPDKKEYRSFRIRGAAHAKKIRTSDVLSKKSPANTGSKKLRTSDVKTLNRQNDDIASLREILSRRFGHPEWTYPKAIVVDGGKTHKKAAETLLAELGIQIPVAAVVKDEKHRPREVLGALRAHITDADAVLANSEAHRFSITLHRKARSRSVTA